MTAELMAACEAMARAIHPWAVVIVADDEAGHRRLVESVREFNDRNNGHIAVRLASEDLGGVNPNCVIVRHDAAVA